VSVGDEPTFPFSKTAARPGVGSAQLIHPHIMAITAKRKRFYGQPRAKQKAPLNLGPMALVESKRIHLGIV